MKLLSSLRRLFQNFSGELKEPDLTPGAWLCYYMGDYLFAHPEEKTVRSAVIELSNGEFIWATETPEWDRDWFEDLGFNFPSRWTLYSSLAGTDVQMRGLGS
ncbi:hypothetical protein I3U64_00435 [Mycobacteroides abscessus subsp. abscessus]|uniref:hypothetical protein n=1 Tax=Mycobacteroides abscessus TaxID=36809 RepID=UPI0009A84470|nr:hypothetical protein [Mycobacteroides abscessus]MBN7458613.1 hypothetical protein [Mycobacteroides abscessus subsp. abscessus]QSM02353.1 hypothetical protein PROPHIGD86-1_79 [Mycobacterium phage prophi86-1]SLJ45367.1 Uncharacterised protein [Mycobacteroides abscessus subsp. abscessus]